MTDALSASPPKVRLCVLGTIDISGSSGAAKLHSQPKLITLLAFLVLARPRGFHRRERVLGLFWPEQSEDRARSSLRTALYDIREAMGPDIVLRRGDAEIGVDSSRLTIDAYDFDAAIEGGHLARALELYRGPLLEGLYPDTAPVERWLDEEREHYHAAAADAAWALAERYEKDGSDLTSAARWARKSAKLARSDERRIRRVMSLLHRAGDAAGAIGVFDEFSRYLSRELDIEPSEETCLLARSIRERGRDRSS